MTNFYKGLHSGAVDRQSSSVVNVISNESIDMGATVVLIAAPATELLARVENGDAVTELAYGVVVHGDVDGILGFLGLVSTY